jgi:hypothetical protein
MYKTRHVHMHHTSCTHASYVMYTLPLQDFPSFLLTNVADDVLRQVLYKDDMYRDQTCHDKVDGLRPHVRLYIRFQRRYIHSYV